MTDIVESFKRFMRLKVFTKKNYLQCPICGLELRELSFEDKRRYGNSAYECKFCNRIFDMRDIKGD